MVHFKHVPIILIILARAATRSEGFSSFHQQSAAAIRRRAAVHMVGRDHDNKGDRKPQQTARYIDLLKDREEKKLSATSTGPSASSSLLESLPLDITDSSLLTGTYRVYFHFACPLLLR